MAHTELQATFMRKAAQAGWFICQCFHLGCLHFRGEGHCSPSQPFGLNIAEVIPPTNYWVFPGEVFSGIGEDLPAPTQHSHKVIACHSPLTHLRETLNGQHEHWLNVYYILSLFLFLPLPGKFYSFYQYYQSPSNQATGNKCREVWLTTTVQVSHKPSSCFGSKSLLPH